MEWCDVAEMGDADGVRPSGEAADGGGRVRGRRGQGSWIPPPGGVSGVGVVVLGISVG